MENPINLLSCLVWLNVVAVVICTILTVRTYLVAKAHAETTGLALESLSELLLVIQKSSNCTHEYVSKVVEVQSSSVLEMVSFIQKSTKQNKEK